MRRSQRYILVGIGVFLFLAVAAMLARALSATGTERSRVLAIAEAQARGDAGAVLADTPACAAQPACVAATKDFVTRLKRPGTAETLESRPGTTPPRTPRPPPGGVAGRAGTTNPV